MKKQGRGQERRAGSKMPLVSFVLSKGDAEWTVADVAGAFKAANKEAVEEVLESLAALGILTAYKSHAGRRWKRTRLLRSLACPLSASAGDVISVLCAGGQS